MAPQQQQHHHPQQQAKSGQAADGAPYAWRAGTGNQTGPFTVDSGGGLNGNSHLSTTPVGTPVGTPLYTTAVPFYNPYFTAAHAFAASNNGQIPMSAPSPFVYPPPPPAVAYASLTPEMIAATQAYLAHQHQQQQQQQAPPTSQAAFEQSLLTLQLSLRAQEQARMAQSMPGSPLVPNAPTSRSRTSSTDNNSIRSVGKATRTSQQPFNPSPLASPHAAYSQVFAAQQQQVASHQRVVPPLPKGYVPPVASTSTSTARTGNRSRRASASKSGASQPASPLNAQAGSSRPSSRLASASSSRATSPRPAPVFSDFASLEHDLDEFASAQGFASAAAAAMSPTESSSRHAYFPTDKPSPKSLAELLSETVVPVRSPSASASGSAGSPAAAAAATASQVNAVDFAAPPPPPSTARTSRQGTAEPSFDFGDDFGADGFTNKEPVAAQIWRMFNKAKNTMPNSARMENLSWRFMSMSLRKQREDASSSAPAATPASTTAPDVRETRTKSEEAEETDAVNELASARKPRATQPAPTADEEEGRGRRGRNTTPKTASASASPEGDVVPEVDYMDWRAKSQSRSRSRPPDYMDWRAQSRSRSRAPDFRVRAPSLSNVEVNLAPATANISRFFGDSGIPSPGLPSPSYGGTASEAQQADDLFAAFVNTFDGASSKGASTGSDKAESVFSIAKQQDPESGLAKSVNETDNLAEIESTLNQLINMQSSSGSASNATSPQLTSPLSQSASSDRKPSLAQQHLKDLISGQTNQRKPVVGRSLSGGNHYDAVPSRNVGYANDLTVNIPSRSNNLPPIEHSQPGTPDVSAPPSPYLFSSSAPAAHFLASGPNSSFEVGSVDSAQTSDYFGSPASYFGSPFVQPNLMHDPSVSGGAVTINPSQLFNGASGALSPGSMPDTFSPPLSSGGRHPLSRVAASSTNRSPSTPDLVGLSRSASSSKSSSAPVSRSHSRSNTVSVPPPLIEGQAFDASSLAGSNANEAGKAPAEGTTICINCSTTNTPLWRRDAEGRPLCNACGLFRNLHGVDRPAKLNTGIIKKRNRAKGGTKEAVLKKSSTSSRSANRRNSLPASGSAPSTARQGALPYPTPAMRNQTSGNS